jgi:uncharacterized membrane protein YdfJ with MMPL/SSD domain
MRYRAMRVRAPSAAAAIERTMASVGVAIITTSVALGVSFAVFAFSGFLVNQHLGYLTALTIAAALLADLLFLPALLVLSGEGRAGVGVGVGAADHRSLRHDTPTDRPVEAAEADAAERLDPA